jgi:hypothetical protein
MPSKISAPPRPTAPCLDKDNKLGIDDRRAGDHNPETEVGAGWGGKMRRLLVRLIFARRIRPSEDYPKYYGTGNGKRYVCQPQKIQGHRDGL